MFCADLPLFGWSYCFRMVPISVSEVKRRFHKQPEYNLTTDFFSLTKKNSYCQNENSSNILANHSHLKSFFNGKKRFFDLSVGKRKYSEYTFTVVQSLNMFSSWKTLDKIVKMVSSLEMTRRNLTMKSTSWKFTRLLKRENFIELCVLTRFLFDVLWRLLIVWVVILFCNGSHVDLWCQKKFSEKNWTQSDHTVFFFNQKKFLLSKWEYH